MLKKIISSIQILQQRKPQIRWVHICRNSSIPNQIILIRKRYEFYNFDFFLGTVKKGKQANLRNYKNNLGSLRNSQIREVTKSIIERYKLCINKNEAIRNYTFAVRCNRDFLYYS